MKIFLLFITAALMAGCASIPKQNGGKMTITAKTGSQVQVTQGENPNTPTTHSSTYSRTRDYTIPAKSVLLLPQQQGPSRLILTSPSNSPAVKATSAVPPPKSQPPAIDFDYIGVQLSKPMAVHETEREEHDTHLGAAQESGFAKALALRERFAAARPILWVGLAVFVLLGGALAYFGWWTKAIIAWVLGGTLVVVSVLLPQINPLWLIGAGALVMLVAGYVVMHAYNSGKVDANANGVNDFVDKVKTIVDSVQPKP